MNLLDTLDAPNLFAPHFRGNTWQPWRAFLAALFALPMDDDAAALYRAHTGRQTAPQRAFTEAALIVGRRGGKSRVLALVATFLACFRDYAPHLAPGEVATIGVLASDRRQARAIMRYVAGLLDAVPLLKQMVVDSADEQITLSNRVVIEVSTASFRSTRGYTYGAILADEVAYWRSDESSANPDTEILRALRPGMASIPGAVLLLASSPYAKKGELYASFRRHYGRDDARVLVWKADTASMNPSIDPAIIAEAYEADPEAASAEYGGDFRSDLADFVTREAVDAVTCWGRSDLPPIPGVAYAAFCDPSGGANDAMTLAIGHMAADGMIVLDMIREARPPFNPDDVVADFAAVLRAYGLARAQGDFYGGEWVASRFREHGITYEASARAKSAIYADLLPLLNARRIELPENPRLSAQLVGLERRTSRAGRDSIDHAPGGHDDLINAAAGVLVGLDLDRRPALVRQAALMVNGKPLPMPTRCDYVTATLAVHADGTAAVVYGARNRFYGAGFTIVDFEVGPLAGDTLRGMAWRLAALRQVCGAAQGATALVPPGLLAQAKAVGLPAHAMPLELEDAELLALGVAGVIADGNVKVTGEVAEKAKVNPWGAAFDFRSGDRMDSPLRTAALQAVSAVLLEAA